MKKRIFFLTLVACLSIILLTCSLNDIKVANAAYIFSDGFESGNLNAWTVFSGALSINTQTVNSGVYSVESIQVGQTLGNLYYQILGGSLPNPIDFREYVYINSTTVPSTSGDYYEVGGFASSTGGNYGDGEICVFNIAQTLYWGVYYRNANSSTGFDFSISASNSSSDATPVSIGWNCVELKHTTGTTTTYGEEQLYLNGVSILDVSADNYQRTPSNVVIGGSQQVANPTDSWNYYIDDVAVSGSYIGPVQYQLTMSTNYGTVIPPSGLYNESQTVTINAPQPTAAQGERYIWQGWVGSGVGSYTGTANPASVKMNSTITETASWEHQYYLTVSSAYGSVSGGGWYDAGSSAYAAVSPTTVAGTTGTQYIFTGWSGDASGTTSPSNAIIMNGPKTATANWQTQYYLTFAQSGVGSDFSGTVMTVNSTVYNNTGFAAWANPGDVYTFSYASPLVVTANGEQYLLTGVSGNNTASILTVSAATTVTGAYKTQYYLTTTSAYDSPSPANGWYDSGSSISAFVSSPVPGASGIQWVCTGWSGTGSVPASGSTSALTFTIRAPSTITWNWQQSSISTPTPTPSHSPTPTESPTPSPSSTASPTPTPTNSSPTPTPSQSTQSLGINVYIYGLVIAIVIVGVIAAVIVIRKRHKS
jgi:uncharacterized repeat protein (TIGR02543 family)